MADNGEDLMIYIAGKFAAYIDTPREVRKRKRMERHPIKEPWHKRWFGMLPLAISMWAGSRSARRKSLTSSAQQELSKK